MNAFLMQDLRSAIQSNLRSRGVQLDQQQTAKLMQHFIDNEHLLSFGDGGKIRFKGDSLSTALNSLVSTPKETSFIV